jgi:hypothetical protein
MGGGKNDGPPWNTVNGVFGIKDLFGCQLLCQLLDSAQSTVELEFGNSAKVKCGSLRSAPSAL